MIPHRMQKHEPTHRWKRLINAASEDKTSPFIWCLALICTVVTLVVIVAGIVVFIGYLVIRPKVPVVKVIYAHLDVFNFDQAGILTTKLSIVISAENGNHKAHASFSDFRYLLSFNGIDVARLQALPFDVANEQSQTLPFTVEAGPIPLDPVQMTFVGASLDNNVIPFELKGHARARWRVGPLGSLKFWCNLTCDLRFERADGNSTSTSHCNSRSI